MDVVFLVIREKAYCFFFPPETYGKVVYIWLRCETRVGIHVHLRCTGSKLRGDPRKASTSFKFVVESVPMGQQALLVY